MPGQELVVAVDIGTTGVKAAAMDAAAVSHGAAEREYPTQSPHPGWAVQDPDVVAASTAAAVSEVVAKAGAPAGRSGASPSGAMHSLIALAADGSLLTPSVTWADGRAAAQARRLRETGQWLALHRRTGTPVHPMSPLVKLLWFREQQPEVWRRAAHWVGIKEYVLFRLTGLLAVDEATASATGCTGWPTATGTPGRWSWWLRREQLPALHATNDVIARLGADVAAWGLEAGTPIVVGASDGVLANLGVGAVAPGVAAPSGPAGPSAVSSASPGSTTRAGCSATRSSRTAGWSGGDQQRRQRTPLAGRVAGADLADPDGELTELAAKVPPGPRGC